MEYFQRENDIAFGISLLTNFILFTVFMILFILLRWCRCTKRVYEPLTVPEWNQNKSFVVKPVKGCCCWGWFFSAMSYSREDILEKRGLDAVMYLEVIKYMFLVTSAYCLYGYIILVPIHATAGGGLTGTAIIGLGNVPDGDPRLAADIVGGE